MMYILILIIGIGSGLTSETVMVSGEDRCKQVVEEVRKDLQADLNFAYVKGFCYKTGYSGGGNFHIE